MVPKRVVFHDVVAQALFPTLIAATCTHDEKSSRWKVLQIRRLTPTKEELTRLVMIERLQGQARLAHFTLTLLIVQRCGLTKISDHRGMCAEMRSAVDDLLDTLDE
jgi:hypothetical protein